MYTYACKLNFSTVHGFIFSKFARDSKRQLSRYRGYIRASDFAERVLQIFIKRVTLPLLPIVFDNVVAVYNPVFFCKVRTQPNCNIARRVDIASRIGVAMRRR